MCSTHLRNPRRNRFELLQNLVIEPPLNLTSTSNQVLLVNALMQTSPKQIKMIKHRGFAVREQIKKSMLYNEENSIVRHLSPCSDYGSSVSFFSPDDIEGTMSSKDFEVCSPIDFKTQIFICQQTQQFLFCLPDPKSFTHKHQEKLKQSLLKTLEQQPKFVNKQAKQRVFKADKWVFTGKHFNFEIHSLI